MESKQTTLDQIVALCKRRGFIYQSAEIYGGLNGVYDVGPLGTLFKENIRAAWKKSLSSLGIDIVMFEGALLGPEQLWNASGHTTNFHDPLIDCLACKHRFRADDIDINKGCPQCGAQSWTDVREFHLMFKTSVGASAQSQNIAYLRPETAQSIFANFKNVMTSSRSKIPFGIAQIGKAFRNEITPKQFLFRMREFEQMEIEWFCREEDTAQFFEFWKKARLAFYHYIGIAPGRVRLRAHESQELAHYSKGTTDVEYLFPFGWKELEGIACRGDFDLRQHSQHSGKDLAVFDEQTKQSFYPNVVECSVGVDRLFLTLLFEAYEEQTIGDDVRTVLHLHPQLAPISAAFLSLSKEHALATEELYRAARAHGLNVQVDHSGSIGKRYRRQDEVGTPLCFTYDFDSAQDQSITVRFRDSMKQERIPFSAIVPYIISTLNGTIVEK